ncbi:MAG: TRAP transporter fused permease subunit [Syntrophobacteraceae bacterium]
MEKKEELLDDEQLTIKRQEELIAELEPESKYRTLTPLAEKVCIVLCLILSLFHVYTAGFGVLQEYEHRAFHLSFVLCLIFICYSIRRREPPRRKSIIQSTIYAILGGTLFSLMLGKVLDFSAFTYVATAVGLGCCLFYFKERVHLPSRIMPPVDLAISTVGFLLVAGLLLKIQPSLGEVKQTSGWPLIVWGILIFSLVLLTLGWQAVQSLRWCLRGADGFKLDPQRLPYFDIVFAIISFAVSSYIIIDFDQFIIRGGMANAPDYFIGVFAIALVLEGTRRSAGVPLTMIAFISLIYCYIGPYLLDVPVLNLLAHRGYTVGRVIEHMYAGTEGIYGIPLGVCATFVFHFVLFGLFIAHTGLGKFFIDLAMAVAGGSPGGPAKVSIIASGFFGMISGSSIANCVTIGSFTIPMMKRIGYRPEFAGAVEASASTGGQIMPPVMGAAAFVMSEWLGIPYLKICLAAAVPAILHFYAIGTMVHFEAVKNGMSGLPREMLPRVKDVLRERGILVLPLFVIMFLLIAGYTPFLAAFWAIILSTSLGQFHSRTWNFLVAIFLTLPSVCVSYTPFEGEWYFSAAWFAFLAAGLWYTYARRRTSMQDWLITAVPAAALVALGAFGVKPFLMAFWTNMAMIAVGIFYKESRMRLPMIVDALEKGTLNALAIGAAVASVGIIIGMTMLTGLGLKFGSLTIQMAEWTAGMVTSLDVLHLLPVDGTILFFILCYTAFACFILGMGLPTTAQYIVAAVIAAPAMLKFGVHPLLSHMFVFFYAILADVTPPVALAAFAGAGIAGSEPFKTGAIATSLSSAKFVVPFVWVYSPVMLLMPWLLTPGASFDWWGWIEVVVFTFAGVTAMGGAWRGYLVDRCTKPEKMAALLGALLFFIPGVPSSLVGAAIIAFICFLQYRRKQRRRMAQAEQAAG